MKTAHFLAGVILGNLVVLTGGDAAAPRDEPLVLTPFEVNEVPEGLPWKYLQTEGYEMISLMPRELSIQELRSMIRGQMMLPKIFQPQRSSPVGVILFDATVTKSPKAFPAVAAHYGSKRLGHDPRMWRGFYNGIQAHDNDSLVIGIRYNNAAPVCLISRAPADHIFLECRPEPRAWLLQALFGPAGLFGEGDLGSDSASDAIRIASVLWVNETETKKLKRNSASVPELIPLARFFNEPPPDEKAAPAAYALWQSQARLFVHWALVAEKEPAFDASAFWRFANDSRLGDVTEEQFRTYFGRDYAAALAELRVYLPIAVKNGVDRVLPGVHEAAMKHKFIYRAASESEVARIKGNFERMEALRLRESDPAMAKRYEEAARRSLLRATRFTPVDPRVYGVLGLLEFDTHQLTDAKRHLEIAYADGGLGSRGLLALARLRLDERKAPEEAAGKLKAAELERVLELLFAARERKPALVETYRLIAEVWERSEVQPTRGHLAVLNEGVRFFPWDDALSEKTKALHRRFGYEAEVAATESR